jgi:hypothetical protein
MQTMQIENAIAMRTGAEGPRRCGAVHRAFRAFQHRNKALCRVGLEPLGVGPLSSASSTRLKGLNPKRRIAASKRLKRMRLPTEQELSGSRKRIARNDGSNRGGVVADHEMENVMQRTDAVKWFWPFVLVATVAAATIIALPPFASKAFAEPQFRMQLTVSAQRADVAGLAPVRIEPSPILVTAKRPASILDRFVGYLPQRKHPS